MPRQTPTLPWASVSMRSTRWPRSAAPAARLTAVVVFPVPPLWLRMAMRRARVARNDSSPREARRHSMVQKYSRPRSGVTASWYTYAGANSVPHDEQCLFMRLWNAPVPRRATFRPTAIVASRGAAMATRKRTTGTRRPTATRKARTPAAKPARRAAKRPAARTAPAQSAEALARQIAEKEAALEATRHELRHLMDNLDKIVRQRSRALVESEAELRRKNVELARLNRMKGEFVSIAAHELRTPLTSIIGYLDLLAEGRFGAMPSGLLRPLESVRRNSQRLVRLVDEMLDASRIEAGRVTLKPRDCSLADIVHAVIDDLSPLAATKGHALTSVREDTPLIR